MIYPVLDIADELLKIAKRKDIALSPMQLMKLVYIAHGWSLAVLNQDIFSDRIEAWKYGPVIPSLYQATKQFGRNKIPLELIREDEISRFPTNIQNFLEDVFNKYGHLSGIQLSNLTHMHDTPWQQVYDPNVSGVEIPDYLIKQHYVSKLNEYEQQSSTTAR